MAFIDEALIEVFFNKLRGKKIMIDKNKLIVASENPNNLKVTSLQLG